MKTSSSGKKQALPVQIRPAGFHDISGIEAIVNLAFAVPPNILEGARTSVAEIHRLMATSTFLIAVEEEAIVGAVQVEVTEASGYFGMLAVKPERQGRGIGRELIEAAEEYCREHGCAELTLTTPRIFPHLIDLYRRSGYIVAGVEPRPAEPHFKQKIDFVRMRKRVRADSQF